MAYAREEDDVSKRSLIGWGLFIGVVVGVNVLAYVLKWGFWVY